MPRRANQEGTFYQRKDGKWCGQVMIEGKRYTAYGNTQNECKRKLRDKTRSTKQRLKGIYQLNDYLYESLEERKKTIKPSTASMYAKYIKRVSQYADGLYLHEVDESLVNTIVAEMRMDGLKETTIRTAVAIFITLLSPAFKDGIIKTISLPKLNKTIRHFTSEDITVERVKEEIDKLKNPHIRFMFKLLLHTGLRIGEARALKWSDIDLKRDIIYVNRTVYPIKGEDVFLPPKNNRVGEFVQFPVSFHNDVVEYKEQDNANKNDYIFYNRNKKPKYPTYYKYARIVFQNLGVEKGACHNFRHFHASLLFDLGVDILTIQNQLRHSSLSVTSNYLHSLKANEREQIKNLAF